TSGGRPSVSVMVGFSLVIGSILISVMRAWLGGAVKAVPAAVARARPRRDRFRFVPIVFIESPPRSRCHPLFGCVAIVQAGEEWQRCRDSWTFFIGNKAIHAPPVRCALGARCVKPQRVR